MLSLPFVMCFGIELVEVGLHGREMENLSELVVNMSTWFSLYLTSSYKSALSCESICNITMAGHVFPWNKTPHIAL